MAVFVNESVAQAVVYECDLSICHHHIQRLDVIVGSTFAMDQFNDVDKLMYHIENYWQLLLFFFILL